MLVRLFGRTTVRSDHARTITEFGGTKPRQILEILALADGEAVTKARLADLLWNGEPPRSYIGTLESYVCVLRRKLGLTGGRTCALTTTTQGYVLDTSQVQTDLSVFRGLMRRALAERRPAVALSLAQRALSHVEGVLLAAEDAQWAAEERHTFSGQMVRLCTRAAADAITLEDFDTAVALAQTAIRHEAFAEPAWQHQMRALWQAGRRCEALRVYFSLRESMLAELAVEPGPPTRHLYLEILRDEPASDTALHVPLRTEVQSLLAMLRHVLEPVGVVDGTTGDEALLHAALSAVRIA